LTINSVSTTGDFSETDNCTSSSPIAVSGTCTINVTFLPSTVGDRTGKLTINDSAGNSPQDASLIGVGEPATPVISWPTPAAISYGTPLGAAQLDASASFNSSTVLGTFVYTPPATTILTPGTYSLNVAFAPNDSTDYTTATGTVNIKVNPATLTVTANSTSMAVGAAVPTLTASYSGFVNGDGAGVLSGSPSLATTATSSSPAGTYPITVTQGTLSAANYTFSFVNGTLSIVAAPTVVITTSALLSGSSGSGYTATITVKNSGTGSASNVVLSTAALGASTGSPLPQSAASIAAGGSTTFLVSFPGSAGLDGAGVAEKYSGTYTGGSFSASVRSVTLP
jgi:hypothetical protein